jgi:AcrR family transcriptional regulator
MAKVTIAPAGPPKTAIVPAPSRGLPPHERIVAAARELFYRQGIHQVSVDAIAEAAGTNKMTLYRHFESKDALVVECLRRLVAEFDAAWDRIALAHPGDPRRQLLAWLEYVGEWKLSERDRGCALANAAIELSDKDHPARRFIEAQKILHRERLLGLCRDARLEKPELLADKVFLLCEGARVCLQSIGANGPAHRLVEMLQGLVAEHDRPRSRDANGRRPRAQTRP